MSKIIFYVPNNRKLTFYTNLENNKACYLDSHASSEHIARCTYSIIIGQVPKMSPEEFIEIAPMVYYITQLYSLNWIKRVKFNPTDYIAIFGFSNTLRTHCFKSYLRQYPHQFVVQFNDDGEFMYGGTIGADAKYKLLKDLQTRFGVNLKLFIGKSSIEIEYNSKIATINVGQPILDEDCQLYNRKRFVKS